MVRLKQDRNHVRVEEKDLHLTRLWKRILITKFPNHPIERIGFTGVAVIARGEFKDRRLQSRNTDLGIGKVVGSTTLAMTPSISDSPTAPLSYHNLVPHQPRLFLIDSFGFIFRAYHARARSAAPPMRTSAGLSTEAVYIFNNMLRKLAKSYAPEYIAAVFESGAPVARMAEFAEYKANRAEMPPDLGEQIPHIRRVLEAMRIPILEFAGFEADDVIGAIARRAEQAGIEVVIVSSDKDMMQIVSERVSMLNPAKDDEWYGPEKVKEFLGVIPAQVPDLFALKGDAIDNIPGAPGIGDKGARDLIERFGSVEAALARAGEVERKMYRESLQNNVERILMSKRLATIDTAVPIEFDLDSVRAREPDPDAMKQVYKDLEFYSLLKELGPSEDTRTRDYQALDSAAAVADWLRTIPADAPVAVAIAESGAGEFALDIGLDIAQATVGMAWKSGGARSAPLAPGSIDGRP
jgi:DNA polymerase I